MTGEVVARNCSDCGGVEFNRAGFCSDCLASRRVAAENEPPNSFVYLTGYMLEAEADLGERTKLIRSAGRKIVEEAEGSLGKWSDVDRAELFAWLAGAFTGGALAPRPEAS